MEKADMVVKEPRKPITKNKNIGEDLLAKNPAIHPIRKQPRTFTKSVPKGIRLEILLFTYSVNKNLRTAPSPPPKAIYKRLMIVLPEILSCRLQNYL